MSNDYKCAVILAGGLGSRLQPYTLTIPKPLLPLSGMPIIEIVLTQLSKQGFKRVIITLGYLGDMIKFIIGDGSRFGLQIEYVVETEPLGTAGSLYLINDLPKKFLVMNGDLLTTFPFRNLLEVLVKSGSKAAVACCKRTVGIDYGVLSKNSENMLDTYNEKPKIDYLVSMGIYAMYSDTLDILSGEKIDMPQFLEKINSTLGGVYLFESEHYWQDIGKLQDFEKAGIDFERDPKHFLEINISE
jgi:NDP-sugar pyrophosphorylase family protein